MIHLSRSGSPWKSLNVLRIWAGFQAEKYKWLCFNRGLAYIARKFELYHVIVSYYNMTCNWVELKLEIRLSLSMLNLKVKWVKMNAEKAAICNFELETRPKASLVSTPQSKSARPKFDIGWGNFFCAVANWLSQNVIRTLWGLPLKAASSSGRWPKLGSLIRYHWRRNDMLIISQCFLSTCHFIRSLKMRKCVKLNYRQ